MMKVKTKQTVAPLALAAAIAGNAAIAHTDDPHSMREFDPTDTEFGSYDPELKAVRRMEISMSDLMSFDPGDLQIAVGEVLEIKVTNDGKLMHELVLGTPDSLIEHAEMMKKFPTMEHEEPYMAHVPPGESRTIVWKFDKEGVFAYGCLVPGHFDAGMKGAIRVR